MYYLSSQLPNLLYDVRGFELPASYKTKLYPSSPTILNLLMSKINPVILRPTLTSISTSHSRGLPTNISIMF